MGFKSLVTGITDGVGLTDSEAGGRALQAQMAAIAESNRIQQEMYDESKERYKPYMEGGQQGFNSLMDLTNNYQNFNESDGYFKGHSGVFGEDDFQADPGYQFRLNEGLKGVERGAAARGGRHGGATMKALAKYGQNMASQEYDKSYQRFNNDYGNAYNRFNSDQANRFNRFGNLASYGQNANNALTGISTNFANNMSNNAMAQGNAIGAAEMAKGNTMKDLWKMGSQAVGMAMGAPGGAA